MEYIVKNGSSKTRKLRDEIRIVYDCNAMESKKLLNQLVYIVDDYFAGLTNTTPKQLLEHTGLDTSFEDELIKLYHEIQ